MNARILNIRHLRVFREVAHSHSVSIAAQNTHLSQPAVTQALRKLEADLGVSLFHRKKMGFYTTEIGGVFLERTERALNLLRIGAQACNRLGKRGTNKGFQDFDQLLTAAQLRAFVAVSETLNYSHAARETGLTQPSIHRCAKDVESLSGQVLFTRSPTGINLTPSAKTLAKHIKLSIVELDQGLDEIAYFLDQEEPFLRIGCLPLARNQILPTAVANMVKANGKIQIQIVDGPYRELLHGLRHGTLDCIIGALRLPNEVDDITQETLFYDSLAVICRKDHPLAKQTTVSLADTLKYPWVAPPKDTPTGKYLFSILHIGTMQGTPVKVVCSSLIFLRGLIIQDDYLSIISLHQIQEERRKGILISLPVNLENSMRAIGITTRKDWKPTETQSILLKILRQTGRAYDTL